MHKINLSPNLREQQESDFQSLLSRVRQAIHTGEGYLFPNNFESQTEKEKNSKKDIDLM
jgi:hypothetical protein